MRLYAMRLVNYLKFPNLNLIGLRETIGMVSGIASAKDTKEEKEEQKEEEVKESGIGELTRCLWKWNKIRRYLNPFQGGLQN